MQVKETQKHDCHSHLHNVSTTLSLTSTQRPSGNSNITVTSVYNKPANSIQRTNYVSNNSVNSAMQSWDSDINRINYEQGYISLPIILSADFRMSMADRICTHQQYIYLLYSAKWLCMDSLFQNLNKWQQVTTDTNKIKHASADTEDQDTITSSSRTRPQALPTEKYCFPQKQV